MPYETSFTPSSTKTIGAATFADCGENKSHLKLFRVNAGVPLREAVEHAAHVLGLAQMLSLEAAMHPQGGEVRFRCALSVRNGQSDS